MGIKQRKANGEHGEWLRNERSDRAGVGSGERVLIDGRKTRFGRARKVQWKVAEGEKPPRPGLGAG